MRPAMKILLVILSVTIIIFAGGWISGHGIPPVGPGGESQSVGFQATPPSHGLPETRLNASDYQPHDFFGYAVDLDGALLAAGAPGKNEAGQEAGGVYVFEHNGGEWAEVARLVPEGLGSYDHLGISVALDGETIAAGAPYATTQDGGFAAGAVYIFVRQGDDWREQARLTARDGGPFDLFGAVVALDGDTLVVGAQGADDVSKGRNTGAAYVFHRENEMWVEQARLSSADGGADDFFGQSLAIHGEVIAVGAFGHDAHEIGPNTGAVYIFRRQDGAWFFQTKLTSVDAAPKAQFGFSLKFVGDQAEPTLLVVGANQYASEPVDPGYDSPPGRIELFRWQNQAWGPAARLVVEQLKENEAGLVGASVAIDLLEGNRFTLAAGSQFGARVHLFRGADENWQQAVSIGPDIFQLNTGRSIAISNPYLTVGSAWSAERFSDGHGELPQTGAVFIYDLRALK